ncbi:endolytic transglycosylase MltG [Candidatus Gottesmanbacteria bacterium]|nr:endolytic transglycosylase MltG [Candidatus Gottesmanbacteria bacterium]
MKKKIIILIAILVILSTTFFLWWKQAIYPADPTNKIPITFSIMKGESARSIAERLKKAGLIRSSVAFFILARFGGLGNNIQAGQFILSPSMDMHTIASDLTHGTIDVRITIPEGWRNEEIALKLAQQLAIPEKEFLMVAKEGYMFPDTYLIPKDATASAVVNMMIANFKSKTARLNDNSFTNHNLSLKDLVIIASIVEREASFVEDRPVVASVILNRLKLGMKLDIDATVQYVLGYQAGEKSWWKKDLTLDDLDINSPFNTYKNAGLPPSPISNPGLAALNAVKDVPDTDFLYYVSDKTGKIHFAKDAEGHNINISKYLNK